MSDTIQRVQYFYTEVPDRPGEGGKLLAMLKEAGVNLSNSRLRLKARKQGMGALEFLRFAIL